MLGTVAGVNGEIAEEVVGRSFVGVAELDQTLIDLDGSQNKSRLGANAIVGMSIAGARANATAAGLPLRHALKAKGYWLQVHAFGAGTTAAAIRQTLVRMQVRQSLGG